MKYSFHCRNCGFTFFSNNTVEVAKARQDHKIKFKYGVVEIRHCPLVPVGKTGTIARPDLAVKLQEQS